ncbi:MAG: divergent polysaccharide deacetylase family protein [Alphaproteobacteria bacterium]|nr:divergent polysaccharide deacetylase family protein [Alphaproteobacteria bacterium]
MARAVGWRGLGWFWVAVLLLLAGGAGVLQVLGPPRPAPAAKPVPVAASVPPPIPAAPTAGLAQPQGPVPPGAVPPPDPRLLEPSSMFPGGMLPHPGPGGLTPMRAYAAAFHPSDQRPRVAVLLGGIGMSETDSEEAIRTTPAAISLAVSPYAFRPERLLADARAAGHELFLALPLEPARYPLDDPGNRALLTGNPSALNRQRLEWALTRFAGYVGATGALNGMRGERFAAASELMNPLLEEFAARGLLYIDPRPGAPHLPYAFGRSVDVVVDEPAVRTEIEANLARLEQVARDRGAALGLVGEPRPVTLTRLAAWAATLGARGLVLAPVSAIAQPPPAPAPRTIN